MSADDPGGRRDGREYNQPFAAFKRTQTLNAHAGVVQD